MTRAFHALSTMHFHNPPVFEMQETKAFTIQEASGVDRQKQREREAW